jgi:hypothetical protein
MAGVSSVKVAPEDRGLPWGNTGQSADTPPAMRDPLAADR